MKDFSREALGLAKRALGKNEVPIGAVLVDEAGRVIGRGYNQTHGKKDGLAHAELLAIRSAQRLTGDWRLEETTMYVTLEPCLMCLGAIANARIAKVCYILADPLFGSVESKFKPGELKRLFPKLSVEKLEDEAEVASLMKEFFLRLRKK